MPARHVLPLHFDYRLAAPVATAVIDLSVHRPLSWAEQYRSWREYLFPVLNLSVPDPLGSPSDDGYNLPLMKQRPGGASLAQQQSSVECSSTQNCENVVAPKLEPQLGGQDDASLVHGASSMLKGRHTSAGGLLQSGQKVTC